MASRHQVADPGTVAPASRVVIEQYLAELAVRLLGPKKACAAVVASWRPIAIVRLDRKSVV